MHKIEWLDSSSKKENPTLLIGKNILIKIIEDKKTQTILEEPIVKDFCGISNLLEKKIRQIINELIDLDEFIDTPSLLKNIMANKEEIHIPLFLRLEEIKETFLLNLERVNINSSNPLF